MNSINDIIELHNSEGKLEDTYLYLHVDETILKLNTYTLMFASPNAEKEEIKHWNDAINEEIQKDRTLLREVKEFRVLFRVLNRLRIKEGYLQKTERPDFVLNRKEKTYGIEITKIYAGNDWVAEKMKEDFQHFNLEKGEIEGYLEYRKFQNKIKTYQTKENIVFQPIHDETQKKEWQVKVKNKIFEKVRKMFDEYETFDVNIVIANIVSPEYFQNIMNLEEFQQELEFFVSHLEVDTTKREYRVILIIKNKYIQFDLSNHKYSLL